MSLITRCPACDTMFKVVPDQLRISEGWVRCGQCGEIFNASQHLVAPEAPPSAADRAPAPTPAPTPAVVTAPAPPPEERLPSPSPWVTPAAGAAAPNPFEQKVWDMAPAIDDPATEPEPESASEPEPEPEPSPASDPIADPLPSAPAAEAATAPLVDPVAREPVWDDAAPAAPPDRPDRDARTPIPPRDEAIAPPSAPPHDELQPPTPSFMQPDDAPSRWQRRPVRLALIALALLLAGLLAGQVLLQERNRIVLVEPGLRPVVQALCQLAHCEITPLRQIESVVIDSSSFGRLRADAYRLAFSLRNQAPIDIAMPAIELSLTDTQDQPVIRRVILPTEFGAAPAVLAAGADWSGTLALGIRPGATTERIAGYRLLAFYP